MYARYGRSVLAGLARALTRLRRIGWRLERGCAPQNYRRICQLGNWESCHEEPVVRFVKDEFGATAIEYGLIAALIAVGIIAAARGLGSQIGATFNTVTTR